MRLTLIVALLIGRPAPLFASMNSGPQVQLGSVKANRIKKTGFLKTTSVSVAQNILTYTVTPGTTFYLEYWHESASLVAPSSTTLAMLGTMYVESPSGVVFSSVPFFNNVSGSYPQQWEATYPEPLPIPGGDVVRSSVTANTASAIFWWFEMVGYERNQ